MCFWENVDGHQRRAEAMPLFERLCPAVTSGESKIDLEGGSVLFGSRRLCAALGYGDQRGPQHAIADRITGLDDLDDGARRDRRIRNLVHRLLKVRIEFFARRIEFLDAVFLERAEQR